MTISYYEKIGDEARCIDEELPFEIPDTWTWMRLENCCIKEIRRGKSPKYTDQSGTLVFAQTIEFIAVLWSRRRSVVL